jgi:hypothetical protein
MPSPPIPIASKRFSILFFAFLILFSSSDPLQAQSESKKRTQLLFLEDTNDAVRTSIQSLGIEVISWVRDDLWMITSQAEQALLIERGYKPLEILRSDDELTLYKRAMYGEAMTLSTAYHTYDEMLHIIDSLIQRHPDRIAREAIGTTQQGKRTIYAVKLSNQVKPSLDRPVVYFTSAIHARELANPEITLALIKKLVTEYPSNPKVKQWMEAFEIYVVPVINVDGHYIVTQNIDPRWRKNARDASDDWKSARYPLGIDLNRNYDFNFAGGGSDDPSSERYRGEYPFSEAEVLAVKSLVERIRPVMSINYHSQGEVIFYPWDWNGLKAPDDKLLTQMARGIADQIPRMDGKGPYAIAYGAARVGQSYPWLYGRIGTFDFIVETGRGAHVFPYEEIPGIVEANLNGAYYLLDRALGPGLSVKVVDARTNQALQAEVWVPSIESEELDRRTTKPQTGRYYRPLLPGSYTLVISKPGYVTQVLKQVNVGAGPWTPLEVRLEPISPGKKQGKR